MPDTSAPLSPSLLRRLLIGFASLVVVLFLLLLGALTYLNWRGERDWGVFRAEWEAKGEKFDIKDFIPTSVPDEQNFAATPLLAATTDFTKPPGQPMQWNNTPLKERASAVGAILQWPAGRKAPAAGSWQTGTSVDLMQWCRFIAANSTNSVSNRQEAARGILKALEAFDAELDELAAASNRPHSAFRLDYNENFRMVLPHLAVLKGIAQTVRLRAVASLAAGQRQEAVDDVKLGLRLAEALKKEPLLISQLVRITMLQLCIQTIWEGVVRLNGQMENCGRFKARCRGWRCWRTTAEPSAPSAPLAMLRLMSFDWARFRCPAWVMPQAAGPKRPCFQDALFRPVSSA